MVIEIADTQEKLDKLMPFLDENVKEGLITMDAESVIKYRHSKSQR